MFDCSNCVAIDSELLLMGVKKTESTIVTELAIRQSSTQNNSEASNRAAEKVERVIDVCRPE